MGQVCSTEYARREALVFEQIERAALAGEAAPSHDRICEATGLSSVQNVVPRLVAQGRIRIHAKHPGRKSNQLAYEVLDASSAACGLRTGMNGHQSLRDAHQREARTQRPCISGCGAKIHSTGPHHRMCDRCRALGDDALPELTVSTGTWRPTSLGGVV